MERLPTELSLMILKSITSIQDLRNFIATHRTFYQLFSACRQEILQKVLRNAVYPDVCLDAITTIEASRVSAILWSPARSILLGDDVMEFIQKYEQERQIHSLRFVSMPSSVIDLFNFHGTVEFFVSDFVVKSFQVMNSHSDGATHLQIHNINPSNVFAILSNTEVGRTQRAFYRFETYRRLFYQSPVIFTAGTTAKKFRELFVPWELEEITCVHQYLAVRLRHLFEEIEKDFIRDVMVQFNREANSLTADDSLTSPRHVLFPGQRKVGFEGYGLEIFLQYSPLDDHIHKLVSRGLPFLHRIFQLTKSQQRDVFLTMLSPGSIWFEVMIKKRSTDTNTMANSTSPAAFKFIGDSLESCTRGSTWANSNQATQSYNRPDKASLREWGYVFWDEATLQQTTILKTRRRSADNLQRFPLQLLGITRENCGEIALVGVTITETSLRNVLGNQWPKTRFDPQIFKGFLG
ncbi:MAG: hypothetical protein MMC33_005764 [Icmadophila ericetorum]|nr:hypothetical protein [Icmadophila ericetorum]